MGIPLDPIWFHPAPGTAVEKEIVEAEERENGLCELVDGTLVKKAPGFEQPRLAAELSASYDERMPRRPPTSVGIVAAAVSINASP